MKNLNEFGYTLEVSSRFKAYMNMYGLECFPSRVVRVERSQIVVVSQDGERKINLNAPQPKFGSWPPVVGDWVGCANDTLCFVLPRTTYLSRPTSTPYSAEDQIIAANIDIMLIVEPLSSFSVGRVERMVAMANNCGIRSWLVGTKSDLVSSAELEKIRKTIENTVDSFFCTSIHDPRSWDKLRDGLLNAGTAVVFGRSGAGKSSLINVFTCAGLETQDVRESDGKGRHTTTRRSLHQANGIILIDSPGIREIPAVEDLDSIDSVFTDIVQLSQGCYFSDCAHDQEPDCSVQDAIRDGELSIDRLNRFRRMKYEALRNDPAHRREQRQNERESSKNATRGRRFVMRQKNRRN